MIANAMTGVEMARTHSLVREVMQETPGKTAAVPLPAATVLLLLQPLYGIDRAAVDAKLEIERRRPSRGVADAAEFGAAVDPVPTRNRRGLEIAVQRIAVGAMVQDDER